MNVLLIVLVIIGGPVLLVAFITWVLIMTNHRRKMEELKLKRADALSIDLEARFAALHSEIKALRDTTTQYDLSIDAALQQTAQRIERLERQVKATTDADTTNVILGGR